MRKFIPLVILLASALLLLALYGPGWYRSYQFRQQAGALITAAEAGNLQGVTALIEQRQRQRVASQLQRYLPADWGARVDSLKLTSYEKDGSDTIWAIFTLRTDGGGGMDSFGLYQGKLRWVYTGGQWQWDFTGSYGAPYATSGEPAWQGLGDYLALAEAL
jgi:hypothetical protein